MTKQKARILRGDAGFLLAPTLGQGAGDGAAISITLKGAKVSKAVPGAERHLLQCPTLSEPAGDEGAAKIVVGEIRNPRLAGVETPGVSKAAVRSPWGPILPHQDVGTTSRRCIER